MGFFEVDKSVWTCFPPIPIRCTCTYLHFRVTPHPHPLLFIITDNGNKTKTKERKGNDKDRYKDIYIDKTIIISPVKYVPQNQRHVPPSFQICDLHFTQESPPTHTFFVIILRSYIKTGWQESSKSGLPAGHHPLTGQTVSFIRHTWRLKMSCSCFLFPHTTASVFRSDLDFNGVLLFHFLLFLTFKIILWHL